MRTLAVALTLAVLTPILGLVVILASVFGVKRRPGSVYERCAGFWVHCICVAAGVRLRVFGREKVAHLQSTGAVYCSNHVSWFDVFSLADTLRHYTFIAKRELADIPIFGRAAKAVGIIFIDRNNRKAAFASLEGAAAEVRTGKSVIIFPEGTRGVDYTLRPFKKGPFVLALSAGVPIVPTVVYGAREVQGKGSLGVRAGVVEIHFLEPVQTSGISYEQRDQLVAETWQRMASFLRDRYGVVSQVVAAGPSEATDNSNTSL